MNTFFIKYIGQLFIAISTMILIAGANLVSNDKAQELRINTLEEKTMSEDLILEKIENINEKLETINDNIKDDITKQDNKLDKIIDKLYLDDK